MDQFFTKYANIDIKINNKTEIKQYSPVFTVDFKPAFANKICPEISKPTFTALVNLCSINLEPIIMTLNSAFLNSS